MTTDDARWLDHTRARNTRPVEPSRLSSDAVCASVLVAARATFLWTAVSAELPNLSPFQQLTVASIAGEKLNDALDALHEHLPGIRARAESGVSVESMLAEYDAKVSAPEGGGGELLKAVLPVAIVGEALRAHAEQGAPPDIWRHLEERLTALELAEPVIHSQLASRVQAWLANARHELPKDAPPG